MVAGCRVTRVLSLLVGILQAVQAGRLDCPCRCAVEERTQTTADVHDCCDGNTDLCHSLHCDGPHKQSPPRQGDAAPQGWGCSPLCNCPADCSCRKANPTPRATPVGSRPTADAGVSCSIANAVAWSDCNADFSPGEIRPQVELGTGPDVCVLLCRFSI
jgi:hypothetical protein